MTTFSEHCTENFPHSLALFSHKRDKGSSRHTKGAVIAREFAGGTGAIKLNATDTAHLILGHVPAPRGDRMPLLDGNLHGCEEETMRLQKKSRRSIETNSCDEMPAILVKGVPCKINPVYASLGELT